MRWPSSTRSVRSWQLPSSSSVPRGADSPPGTTGDVLVAGGRIDGRAGSGCRTGRSRSASRLGGGRGGKRDGGDGRRHSGTEQRASGQAQGSRLVQHGQECKVRLPPSQGHLTIWNGYLTFVP